MLAQWYPPIIGGEELHVRNLAIELARRDHAVTVATLAQPGLPERESHDGVEVIRLRSSAQRLGALFADPNRQSAAPVPDPELVIALDRVVGRVRPDVMHAHNWMVHAALPSKILGRAPLLLSLHDFSLVCATKVLLRGGVNCSGPAPMKCLACAARHYGVVKGSITTISNAIGSGIERRVVSGFIPVSTAVAEGNRLAGLPHRVIPNFVPDEVSAADGATTAYLDRLPDEPFLLFVGALGRLKGLPVLLDAYRRLTDPPPLVLIGYPMRETDEILADLPPNVRVLGQWPPQAVLGAWKAARLAIVPSICQEACPTVVIEAMQAGVPIVATRMGGIPDLVVADETGLLVPPSDPAALAGAIASMLNDPGRASQMAAAGMARAARFTASAVVPLIEGAYREVIETGTLRAAS
jgi:glycosyltransferase involved in cell wall biosynthesis